MSLARMSFLCLTLAAACTTQVTSGGDDDDPDGGRRKSDGGATNPEDPNDPNVVGVDGGPTYVQDATTPATRPPPVITNVSPLAGDYGTLVTITGDNLDEASARVVLDGPVEPVKLTMPAPGSADVVVMKWSKTEIQFKYPFPADGAVRVATASGSAEGGTFVPTWTPGVPVSGVFTRRELLGPAVSTAAKTLVAAFDGATGPQILIAYPDGHVESKSFTRGSQGVSAMTLYLDGAGGVEGFYVDGGKLWQMKSITTSPTPTSTNVATTLAAGGRDATGPYAWIKKGTTQFVRVRPPTWAESGSAVTDPTPANAPGPSITTGPDHSLYAGWGVNDSGSFPLYDHTAHPVSRRLRPGLTSFDAERGVGGGADDYMVWTRFLAGPDGRIRSYYCANDTGAFSSPSIDCGEGYASAGTPVPSDTVASEYVVGWNTTTSIAALCDVATNTIKMGPEGQTAQQTSILFPCPRIVTVTADAANQGTLLVQTGNYTYAPRKRQ